MMQFTEEQRKALIEFTKQRIEALRFSIKQHAFESIRKPLQSELAVAEIAMAALTARPVGWTDAEELRDVQRSGCGYIFSANPVTPDADERRVLMLYTTPPLAAPAVPDEALIDKVCLTAAGIFGQDVPDEAQEIVNRIRAMLTAASEVG